MNDDKIDSINFKNAIIQSILPFSNQARDGQEVGNNNRSWNPNISIDNLTSFQQNNFGIIKIRSFVLNINDRINVKELVFEQSSCNDLKNDLEISGYPNLEKIVVKKNSLKNLNSLKICTNEKLKTIETEDGDYRNEDCEEGIITKFEIIEDL